MAAVQCPRCHRYKLGVSEDAILDQLEEDGAYQCSSCGHRFDPFADAEARHANESDAQPDVSEFIKRRKQ